MDESQERIEGLKKCPNLRKYFDRADWNTRYETKDAGIFPNDLWLPRIDQHLAILKEKGWFYEITNGGSPLDIWVEVYKEFKNGRMIQKSYRHYNADTEEKALDRAVEWVLEQGK